MNPSIYSPIFTLLLMYWISTLQWTALAHKINVINRCSHTVWVGTQTNGNGPPPLKGGFQLNQGAVREFDVQSGWGGRIWGRTNCNTNGHCETGDCGNRIECAGNGGQPPATLAEIKYDGFGSLNNYDISLVDGYNIQMSMKPTAGMFQKQNGVSTSCGVAGCFSSMNTDCPQELQLVVNKQVVACYSACEKFQTPQYCCRDQFNNPQTCKSSNWPKNYPAIFKKACPKAYSYAYDDPSSLFTCPVNKNGPSSFDVTFCG